MESSGNLPWSLMQKRLVGLMHYGAGGHVQTTQTSINDSVPERTITKGLVKFAIISISYPSKLLLGHRARSSQGSSNIQRNQANEQNVKRTIRESEKTRLVSRSTLPQIEANGKY